VFSQNRPGWS